MKEKYKEKGCHSRLQSFTTYSLSRIGVIPFGCASLLRENSTKVILVLPGVNPIRQFGKRIISALQLNFGAQLGVVD